MAHLARRTAVLGRERTDEPFPFATYVALASARDHLGPVAVRARHLPYGVWWDRLRPTIELSRPTGEDDALDDSPLPLDGLWDGDRRFLAIDDAGYAAVAATYRTGDGLF